MLDYCKLIVEKVSFDKVLFEKEFRKSLDYLVPEEIEQFVHWAYQTYGEEYSEIIMSTLRDLI